jgi:Transposase DDE domain
MYAIVSMPREQQALWRMPAQSPMHQREYKYLAIHMHERARQRPRALAETPAFAQAQRQRKKVEALFAELKNQIGLSRLRLRRMKFVREQFFLAATAQNLRRLVHFLNNETKPTLAMQISKEKILAGHKTSPFSFTLFQHLRGC